jgi:hypothetical protein
MVPVKQVDSGVVVADTVLAAMRGLPTAEARVVARAVLKVPAADVNDIGLVVPGDPEGTQYHGVYSDDAGPVVLFRDALPGEDGRFVVAALMPRDALERWLPVAGDETARAVAGSVAALTVAALPVPVVEGDTVAGPASPPDGSASTTIPADSAAGQSRRMRNASHRARAVGGLSLASRAVREAFFDWVLANPEGLEEMVAPLMEAAESALRERGYIDEGAGPFRPLRLLLGLLNSEGADTHDVVAMQLEELLPVLTPAVRDWVADEFGAVMTDQEAVRSLRTLPAYGRAARPEFRLGEHGQLQRRHGTSWEPVPPAEIVTALVAARISPDAEVRVSAAKTLAQLNFPEMGRAEVARVILDYPGLDPDPAVVGALETLILEHSQDAEEAMHRVVYGASSPADMTEAVRKWLRSADLVSEPQHSD